MSVFNDPKRGTGRTTTQLIALMQQPGEHHLFISANNWLSHSLALMQRLCSIYGGQIRLAEQTWTLRTSSLEGERGTTTIHLCTASTLSAQGIQRWMGYYLSSIEVDHAFKWDDQAAKWYYELRRRVRP